MESNYYDISYVDTLDEILKKIRMLERMLNKTDTLQPYLKASLQILRPLRSNLVALDRAQEEERVEYMCYLIKEYECKNNRGNNN